MLTLKEKTQAVVTALEDIKASNIVIIDTSKLSSLFQCMVIASANSPRQTRALAGHLAKELKLRGADVLGTEGEESGEWVLVDLDEVIVHIMQPAVRAYYRLEELWDKQYKPPIPIPPNP